jgi:hypothetical protein
MKTTLVIFRNPDLRANPLIESVTSSQ